MSAAPQGSDPPDLLAEWPFSQSAALGSSVRAQGIEREIKARLPFPDRKRLTVEGGRVRLRIPPGQNDRLAKAVAIVTGVLQGIDALPVLPGEAEDILTIAPRERLKWTKDGRLQSAGTRTVKLRGRVKAVTFHVFDPRHIEDVLDRDLPALWREADIAAAAETRRRAAGKAALTRADKSEPKAASRTPKASRSQPRRSDLKGWDAFDSDGLLR